MLANEMPGNGKFIWRNETAVMPVVERVTFPFQNFPIKGKHVQKFN